MRNSWIGFLAIITSALSLLPTVYTVVKNKSTHSINYLYTGIGFLAQLFWIIYALLNKDLPLSLLAIYMMIVYITISYHKWYYERTQQDVYSQLKNNC